MEVLKENVPRAHDMAMSAEKPPAKLARVDFEEKLLVKKLNDKATLPKRGSAGAAGYDLARCAFKRVCGPKRANGPG